MSDKKEKLSSPFGEGGNGNPEGAGAVPSVVREARRLNRYVLAETINSHIHKTVSEIENVLSDPNTVALDIVVCQMIRLAGMGNIEAFNLLLDRLIGKVPNKEISQTSTNPVLEKLKQVSPDQLKGEIDMLLHKRKIIYEEARKEVQKKRKEK